MEGDGFRDPEPTTHYSFASRLILRIPSAGPIASAANAHGQPTHATSTGMIWIVIVVSRKPTEV